jgi:hypothetical protein
MRQASRITVLSNMNDLRRPCHLPEGADPEAPDLAWKDAEDAESHILEIAELAYVLQADGFPIPEVFKRIGLVLDPPSDDFVAQQKHMGDWSDPLRSYLIDYLRRHQPAYVALGGSVFSIALAIAELWAEIYAERLTSSSWPPNDMLGEGAENAIEALDAELQKPTGLVGYDYRRLRARAVPGDEVRTFSTGQLSWQAMMGSFGLALVRDGRSIDHVTTIMN